TPGRHGAAGGAVRQPRRLGGRGLGLQPPGLRAAGRGMNQGAPLRCAGGRPSGMMALSARAALPMHSRRNSHRFELLVFDWDGTLMDSVATIVACTQAAFRDL